MAVGALEGIRVVEYGTMVSAPFCGKLMADLGADVIKVEPPEGDPSRQVGPFPHREPDPECSALFLYNNTSKRGMTLDLEKPEGMEVFKRLLQWADALVDNFPPGHLEGLGLTWEVIKEINPKLVYTSITPYGRTGPRAGVKGDELTLVHAGTLGNLNPSRSYNIDRAPVKLGSYGVGYNGGIHAALITLAGVLAQRQTGSGQMIDVSLQEVVLAVHRAAPAGTIYHDTVWSRVPNRPPALGRMKTSDGYILVGAVEDHHFKALVELMGTPPWASAPEWLNMGYRINHSMEIAPQLDEWMANQKKDDIHHRGAKMGIPMGPVNTVKDVMEDDQYRHREFFVEVEHPASGKYVYPGWSYRMTTGSPRISRPAPLLGEHNREICCNVLGYSPENFASLQKAGAVLSKKGENADGR